MNKKIFASLILIVSVIGLIYYFPGCTADDILNPEASQIYANGSLTPVNRTTVSGNMFVTDQNGNPIQGLDANNITARLRWDAKDTPPDSVLGTVTITPATQQNIGAPLTMDYSGSMGTTQIQCMEDGVHAYINGMSSTDVAEIIKFSSTVQVMQGFTSDTALLHQAVNTFFSGGGLTALYESIDNGVTDVSGLSSSNYLRTVIAFTDGIETVWSVPFPTMITNALTAGIPVFTVTLTDNPTGSAADTMRIIADTTGGFPFIVDPNNCGGLSTIYQQINNQLNNAYSITINWQPPSSLPPGGTPVTAIVTVTYEGLTATFQRTYNIPFP